MSLRQEMCGRAVVMMRRFLISEGTGKRKMNLELLGRGI